MFDRRNPSLFDILEGDDTLPLDPFTRRCWVANLRHPLRLSVMHLVRLGASLLLFVAYFVKRALPFQFRAHTVLQGTICWFMKYLVTPEANYLILRHFWTESNLINFIIANSRNRNAAPVDLYPNLIRELMVCSFVAHDVALFDALHDLGPTEGEPWPVPRDRLDFSLMRDVLPAYDIERRKWSQFLDFETAHELFKTTFCVLVTAEEYERSINSFQFDQVLAIRIARILGEPELCNYAANTFPLSLVGPRALTYRFVLHGLAVEHLHARLEQVRSRG